jgi:ABC-type Co2+ transport system permease subunit
MNGLPPLILLLGPLVAAATVMLSLSVIFLALGQEGTVILGLDTIVLAFLLEALLTRGSEEDLAQDPVLA